MEIRKQRKINEDHVRGGKVEGGSHGSGNKHLTQIDFRMKYEK